MTVVDATDIAIVIERATDGYHLRVCLDTSEILLPVDASGDDIAAAVKTLRLERERTLPATPAADRVPDPADAE